jgi:hypothetical protein
LPIFAANSKPIFMKKYLLLIIFFISSLTSVNFCYAQGVAVNTDGSTADPSAVLDVKSTGQGVLVPRMTLSNRTLITSPATGLLVYQTDNTPGFYYNAGTPVTPNWTLLGATGPPGAGFANGTSAGQVYLTGGSPFAPQSPQTVTGDITITGTAVTSYNNIVPTNKGGAGNVNGILSANGAGTVSAASTTGSGNVVLATSPTLVTPALGTPSALVGTNISGTAASLTAGNVITDANLTGDVTSTGNATTYNNIVPIAKGGTGTASPNLVAGSNVTITGAWPNQTIAATSGGASATALTFISSLLNLAYTGNPTLFFNPNAGVIAATHTGVTYTGANDFADQDNIIMPVACTISSLTVASNTIFTGTGSDNTAFTVYKNGAAQAMTCTVSNTNTVGNVSSVTDNTHTFTVAAGDRISISFKESNSNGTSAPYISYGVILKTQ